MLLGYARVSKADGSQSVDLQIDALTAAGVARDRIYIDHASGVRERKEFAACLKALRPGEDTLVVWKIDRLGRDVKSLMSLMEDLGNRSIGLHVLSGLGTAMDTTAPTGRFVFAIVAAIAEYERSLIRERTLAGLEAARARGRLGGRPKGMTAAKLRMAAAALSNPQTKIQDICSQFGVSKATLYRYLGPDGSYRPVALAVLESEK
ncbi:recombinase family protein [Labrys sp. 22185]|uniref:recombinase family protein n=1 Tax=Labrys sp. 22185 TaxID=3453888 RepID=UPI003F87B087